MGEVFEHTGEAIQAMVATYQEIEDLKSRRDSTMKSGVFELIKNDTLKELSDIQVC